MQQVEVRLTHLTGRQKFGINQSVKVARPNTLFCKSVALRKKYHTDFHREQAILAMEDVARMVTGMATTC